MRIFRGICMVLCFMAAGSNLNAVISATREGSDPLDQIETLLALGFLVAGCAVWPRGGAAKGAGEG